MQCLPLPPARPLSVVVLLVLALLLVVGLYLALGGVWEGVRKCFQSFSVDTAGKGTHLATPVLRSASGKAGQENERTSNQAKDYDRSGRKNKDMKCKGKDRQGRETK